MHAGLLACLLVHRCRHVFSTTLTRYLPPRSKKTGRKSRLVLWKIWDYRPRDLSPRPQCYVWLLGSESKRKVGSLWNMCNQTARLVATPSMLPQAVVIWKTCFRERWADKISWALQVDQQAGRPLNKCTAAQQVHGRPTSWILSEAYTCNIYTYTYIYTYMYIYIYTYTYIYIYIHNIYIHTYI